MSSTREKNQNLRTKKLLDQFISNSLKESTVFWLIWLDKDVINNKEFKSDNDRDAHFKYKFFNGSRDYKIVHLAYALYENQKLLDILQNKLLPNTLFFLIYEISKIIGGTSAKDFVNDFYGILTKSQNLECALVFDALAKLVDSPKLLEKMSSTDIQTIKKRYKSASEDKFKLYEAEVDRDVLRKFCNINPEFTGIMEATNKLDPYFTPSAIPPKREVKEPISSLQNPDIREFSARKAKEDKTKEVVKHKSNSAQSEEKLIEAVTLMSKAKFDENVADQIKAYLALHQASKLNNREATQLIEDRFTQTEYTIINPLPDDMIKSIIGDIVYQKCKLQQLVLASYIRKKYPNQAQIVEIKKSNDPNLILTEFADFKNRILNTFGVTNTGLFSSTKMKSINDENLNNFLESYNKEIEKIKTELSSVLANPEITNLVKVSPRYIPHN